MLGAGGKDMDRVIADAIEDALRRHVPLRWFRLRPFATHLPAESSSDGVGGSVLRLAIPARSVEGGWMVEVGLPSGHVVSSAERQAVARAAAIWELAVELSRRGGSGPSALWRHSAVRDGAAPLIGRSQAMRSLRERIERVAAVSVTVLIEGESGSGKELVARQIHELSARRRGPFVAVNCAALVETLLEAELFGIEDRTATGVRGRRGKFEHAAGGTLFLDEVADLSPSAQAKLLRAIQDCSIERVGGNVTHHVDLRLVVATNRCLRDRVAEGAFRADLYYRLSGVELIVPPLRTRREDVVELADYFLTRRGGGQALTLTPEVVEALHIYDWPGNVRELERMMEAVVVLTQGDRVQLIDLPQSVRGRYAEILEPSLAERDSLRGWGSRYVHLVWQRCGQNKREACRVLDISYHTLQVHLTAFRGAAPLAGADETRRDRWPTPLMLPAVASERTLDGQRHAGPALAEVRPGASRSR
jgi:transcriptional regulator with PAS, ATPase and Fis domain